MGETKTTIATTVAATAAALAPTLAALDPKVAIAVQLVPLALRLLQAASDAHDAGLITDQQLVDLFASTGIKIRSTQAAWDSMNAADAASTA